MGLHPKTAAGYCNGILTDIGLAPLNTNQMDLEGMQFSEISVPSTPLMSGLFEAAISGNYAPLQMAPPGAPPIPQASFGGGDGFSDDEGGSLAENAQNLQTDYAVDI